MTPRGEQTYVGIGLGAIQAGTFIYEAQRSGWFKRLVVAEILPEVVAAVRKAKGRLALNIAHADHIEKEHIGPIEIFNPLVDGDRKSLVDAIADAQEISTSLPSVHAYCSNASTSIHRVLAEGLRRKVALNGPRTLVYTAENNSHAAAILEENIFEVFTPSEVTAVQPKVQSINTVIAKMSGVISNPDEIRSKGLKTITPDWPNAWLVEAFNHILISAIKLDEHPNALPFVRGLSAFEEKQDLMPFEEVKFYGHNAAHALAAYVGRLEGLEGIDQLARRPELMSLIRNALFEESGQALIRKYSGADPLFTDDGFRAYSDDILRRMMNPCLGDSVARVARDPERKLGWDDRLVGAMRLTLQYGIIPNRYACGAAAALIALQPTLLNNTAPAGPLLEALWAGAKTEVDEKTAVVKLIETQLQRLRSNRGRLGADIPSSAPA
jgi:mannitol-1-phosphate 5-dehydrogenase